MRLLGQPGAECELAVARDDHPLARLHEPAVDDQRAAQYVEPLAIRSERREPRSGRRGGEPNLQNQRLRGRAAYGQTRPARGLELIRIVEHRESVSATA